MKKYLSLFITTSVLLMAVAGCNGDENASQPAEKGQEVVTLTVSAAASLRDVLEEIKVVYLEENNVKLKFNYGGSGSLQQQISQGAPVDLFFSAAEDKFDSLVQEGIIAEEDGIDLLGNEIVLIGAKETKLASFDDLKSDDVKKMSIGTPESVPAGKYAKESLENMGLWGVIESKIVYAKDVRQVLSYVETGNVEAGIVYRTDALSSDKVTIIEGAREETHSPIVYPVGIIKDSKEYEQAREFYLFLQSDEIKRLFEEYGFTTK